MDLNTNSLCEKCGAVLKDEVCLNCGNGFKEPSAEEAKSIDSIDPQENKQVTSIFEQLVSADYDLLTHENDTPQIEESPKKKMRVTVIVMMVISFLFLASASYAGYEFYLKKIKYISPAEVATKSDGKSVEELLKKIEEPSNAITEREVDVDLGLVEGNFEKVDYSMFAGAGNHLLIEMFNFESAMKNVFDKKDLIDQIKKAFDITEDDFLVYFEMGFAFVFPDNDFDKWGVILSSKDEKFLDQKLEIYKKLAQDKKTIYSGYFMEKVKVNEVVYLVISNSKVTLDQMVEYSEGNLQNLADDAIFVEATENLPKLGSIFVYKQKDTRTWDYFVEGVSKEYQEYEGFDQLLSSIDSTAIVMYSKDKKTRIVTPK